jgi:hypothetical protein
VKNLLRDPVDVYVSHMPHMKPMEVRMKMGAETNNEILKT